MEHWGDTVTQHLNKHRNYIVNQSYDRVGKYCQEKGLENMPSPQDMYKVIMRQFKIPKDDATKEEKDRFEYLMGLFVWYWDVLLCPVACTSHYWRPSIRHNQTISKAKFFGEVCVPEGTEAMCLVLYENYHKRWKNKFAPERADCGRKKWDHPTKPNQPDYKLFTTKYTSSDQGSAKFGGWSDAGRKRYDALKKDLETIRKQGFSKQLEKLCLQRVRLANGFAADQLPDPDACYKKSAKKRKVEEVYECD